MPERLRHYADDRASHAINNHRAADDIRTRAEMLPPEVIANDNDCWPVLAIFFFGEIASARRWQAEHRQKIRTDPRGGNVPRRVFRDCTDSHVCGSRCSDVFENLATELAPLPPGLFA
jgi:hypothetical protein